MTGPAGGTDPADLPPRLVWLNGPPGIGKHSLAAFMHTRWKATIFDAEAAGLVLERGLPLAHQTGDVTELAVWHTSVVGLGTTLAQAYRPLVVMPATLHRSGQLVALIDQFRHGGVDVAHVILTAEDGALRERFHERRSHRDVLRWRLQQSRPVAEGLASLRDVPRIDTTHRSTDQIAHELADVLADMGWLTRTGQWTTEPTS